MPHATMRRPIQRARALLERAIEQLAASPELGQSTVEGLNRWAAEVRALAR